jgi:hypothetical protein
MALATTPGARAGPISQRSSRRRRSCSDGTSVVSRRTCETTAFLSLFWITCKKRSLCQDRLGTNTGKRVEEDGARFLQAYTRYVDLAYDDLSEEQQDGLEVSKPISFAMPFIYKMPSFCQDRLGTNIGKAALKQRDDDVMFRLFSQALEIEESDWNDMTAELENPEGQ